MRIIPVADVPYQTLTFEMEGESIDITLSFNYRTGCWSMTLERDGAPILSGQRIVTGTDLLRAHGFKLGALFCVADGQDQSHPGRSDFGPGKRVQLVHATEAEKDAAVES